MSEKWLGYGAAFTATTIFGLTFLFSKIALSLVTPVHLVALRFLCAALLFLAGAASVFGFFCTNFALQKIAASQYAVFNNDSTVVSILAGVLFLREEMQWYQWLGGGLIILGVWGTNYFRQEKGAS